MPSRPTLSTSSDGSTSNNRENRNPSAEAVQPNVNPTNEIPQEGMTLVHQLEAAPPPLPLPESSIQLTPTRLAEVLREFRITRPEVVSRPSPLPTLPPPPSPPEPRTDFYRPTNQGLFNLDQGFGLPADWTLTDESTEDEMSMQVTTSPGGGDPHIILRLPARHRRPLYNTRNTYVVEDFPYPDNLTQHEINKFPVRDVSPDDLVNDDNVCSICWENFALGQQIRTLPCCGSHRYHPACSDKWLEIKRTCPLCREELCPPSPEAARRRQTSGFHGNIYVPDRNRSGRTEPRPGPSRGSRSRSVSRELVRVPRQLEDSADYQFVVNLYYRQLMMSVHHSTVVRQSARNPVPASRRSYTLYTVYADVNIIHDGSLSLTNISVDPLPTTDPTPPPAIVQVPTPGVQPNGEPEPGVDEALSQQERNRRQISAMLRALFERAYDHDASASQGN